ncbi:MAG: F420-dependent NADP oxidoreductase [Chitinophagaceae bacterium]|nr:F420-dependent NADP oxidoreductase [Chitinophagaceae bacterium]
MNIVILGSGNAAAVLGRKFKAAGHQIKQVYSRQAGAASALAYEWDTESTNYLSLITQEADVYIIAVSDNAIAELATQINLPGKVVAHTAASVSASVLKPITEHYGVFYPLQSLRRENPQLPEIPIYFDGATDRARNALQALASSIASGVPAIAGDEARQKLHVAAVFVNNFVNHLYVLAQTYCEKEGIDFRQLLPLIDETAERIHNISPKSAQTGPALRHDEGTVQSHLQLLEKHPELKKVYIMMTESIQG